MSHISHARTTIREIVAVHQWKIENFEPQHAAIGFFHQGLKFGANHQDGIKWSLQLFPNGGTAVNAGNITLKVHFHSVSSKVIARFNVEVIRRTDFPEIQTDTEAYEFSDKVECLEINKFLSHDVLLNDEYGLIVDDAFTLSVKVFYFFENEPHAIQNLSIWKQGQGLLNQSNLNLLKTGEFSDIIVYAGAPGSDIKKIRAHKLILMSRSPVFAAMFRNEATMESMENCIRIVDFDSRTVCQMIEFIYTDNIRDLKFNEFQLMQIARKYQIKDLEPACEALIVANLSPVCAFEALEISVKYDILSLQKFCVRAISYFFTFDEIQEYSKQVSKESKELLAVLF